MVIHVYPTSNLHMFILNRASALKTPDVLTISSDVNNVGLLTIDKIVLFNVVECSWYNNAAGINFHLPIRMQSGTGNRAARAIVGADIRIDCVLNHASSNPNTGAAYLTTVFISEYRRQINSPLRRKERNGSSALRTECFNQRYTKWTKGTGCPFASNVENHMGTP